MLSSTTKGVVNKKLTLKNMKKSELDNIKLKKMNNKLSNIKVHFSAMF